VEISEVKFNEELNAAIKKAGSARAFARQAGVSAQYVSDVVNGKRHAGDAIARALGYHVHTRRVFERTFSK
jgi:hypothetical protein